MKNGEGGVDESGRKSFGNFWETNPVVVDLPASTCPMTTRDMCFLLEVFLSAMRAYRIKLKLMREYARGFNTRALPVPNTREWGKREMCVLLCTDEEEKKGNWGSA
jgi:hypothetical protein